MKRLLTAKRYDELVRSAKDQFQFKEFRSIGQLAICISLQAEKRFGLHSLVLEDSEGYEFSEKALGVIDGVRNDGIYKALLNHQYEKKLTENELDQLLKAHLDHGMSMLEEFFNSGQQLPSDFLIQKASGGLGLLSTRTTYGSSENSTDNTYAYRDILNLDLGKDVFSGGLVTIPINDEVQFDSQHFAIAGMNGSGKTQLVKDLLYQISETTDRSLKFIFFDYKGEGNSEQLRQFLSLTDCHFIDIKSSPFFFNPLISIPLDNKREQSRLIKTFRDKLGAIDKRIGAKQKNNIELAIRNCFNKGVSKNSPPSIVEVYQELLDIYEDFKLKEDSATTILKDLADIVFAENYDHNFKLFDRSLYINLPTTLPDSARKASVFLILNYILNHFIELPDVKPDRNRIKPIRYVVVIDEAHAYLKNPNMASVLEDMLRMLRSKGVIIMLLSQGIEEYKQRSFDFASQVKIPILLNLQNKEAKLAKTFLGTPKNDRLFNQALVELDSGLGVINFYEPRLIKVNQFWKRVELDSF